MSTYTPTKLDTLGRAQNALGLQIEAHNAARPDRATSNRYSNPQLIAGWVTEHAALRAEYDAAVEAVKAECNARGIF
jgi:hypothetical protein